MKWKIIKILRTKRKNTGYTDKMEFLTSYFFIKAFITAVLAGAACGIVGVWVYLLNIPFVGVAMAHTAFAGAILGLLIGVDPVLLAMVLCIVSSLFIGPLAEKVNFSGNMSMGILFLLMLGIAFLLMSKLDSGMSEALSFMWGNILLVSIKDIYLLGGIVLVLVLFMLIFKKGIISVIYNRLIARACGIPERFIFFSLLILCAITVSLNIKTIGGLLIYSLITIPAATAAQFSEKLKSMYALSIAFAVISCIAGLFISYLFDLPVGASVIVATSLIFMISFVYKKMIRG